MDLDTLKDDLRASLEQHAHATQKSGSEHAQLLAQKTNDILAIIKRNLRFDLTMGVISIFALSVLLFVVNQYVIFRVTAGAGMLVSVILAVVVVTKHQRLSQIELQSGSVKEMLEQSIALIRGFIKFYMQYTIAVIPIGMLVGFLTGFTNPEEGDKIFGTNPITPVIVVVVSIILIIVGVFYTKQYLNRLYGRHLQSLIQCLNELNQQ